MQIFYVTFFMISIFVTMLFGISPEQQDFTVSRRLEAAQMGSWHKGAVQTCVSTTCSGLVNPVAKIAPTVSSGPAFSASDFRTHYDPVTDYLVTSVDPSALTRTKLSYETIMLGLVENVNGESSSIGIYDAVSGLVKTSVYFTVKDLALPAAISSTLPNGSPVIITKLGNACATCTP